MSPRFLGPEENNCGARNKGQGRGVAETGLVRSDDREKGRRHRQRGGGGGGVAA